MRVIAGIYGGRRLQAPRGREVRPTADRVKEALFSMLGPLDGLAVLDLFAGSGALGIEALSRGAASAVFVDGSEAATTVIAANLRALGAQGEIVRRPVRAYLDAARSQQALYDLVFLDPPYRLATDLGPELSSTLPPVLARGARVVAECDRRLPLQLPLALDTERCYGDTLIRIHHAP
ncbi:MAG TPA: 16S rRNA (guanine(966)-N(2))-methyltransferase RsmD [Solirubrobacteraceae bacterium]|nr:16S rRNA (guanine(966)-N(2))-methyltransferase RsmD [Solirubrobacteraceae bacterium]